MKSKIKQIIYLIFFMLLTNTNFSYSHNYFNGGCRNHCKESFKSKNIEKKVKNINDKNLIEDNYSCLIKSLCRG